jgi:hypothetical protein
VSVDWQETSGEVSAGWRGGGDDSDINIQIFIFIDDEQLFSLLFFYLMCLKITVNLCYVNFTEVGLIRATVLCPVFLVIECKRGSFLCNDLVTAVITQ